MKVHVVLEAETEDVIDDAHQLRGVYRTFDGAIEVVRNLVREHLDAMLADKHVHSCPTTGCAFVNDRGYSDYISCTCGRTWYVSPHDVE